MNFFCSEKKLWPFLDPFLVQNLTIFNQNQVFGHFLWNRTSASSETGDNCFESSNGSVVLGKILILLFIYYHFYSFGIGRHCFLCFFLFSRRRETSALRACLIYILYSGQFLRIWSYGLLSFAYLNSIFGLFMK